MATTFTTLKHKLDIHFNSDISGIISDYYYDNRQYICNKKQCMDDIRHYSVMKYNGKIWRIRRKYRFAYLDEPCDYNGDSDDDILYIEVMKKILGNK